MNARHTIFVVGWLIFIALVGQVVAAAPATGQTSIDGNPDCADLGMVGDGYLQVKDDPPTLHRYETDIMTIAYNNAQTVAGVLSLDPHTWLIGAVIVKGGPSANVWTFPDGVVSAPGPMTAPTLENGNTPDISHVTVCLCEKEPTTDTSINTTTTTAPTVPPKEEPPSEPTTTTSTSSPPISTTTTIPTTDTKSPPSSTTPPATSVPEPPDSTPSPPPSSVPSTTAPPSTTTPAEITQQTGERLPDTGLPTGWLGAIGVGMLTAGIGAIHTDRRRVQSN